MSESVCKVDIVDEYVRESDCKVDIVDEYVRESDCKVDMVENCDSTIVFNSLIAATAIGIVSEYDKPR